VSRRRFAIVGFIVLALASAAAWFVLLKPGGVKQALTTLVADTKLAIESWAGKQILAIANAHLNPQLSFDHLRFEFPATVHLENVQLKSNGVPFITSASMRIEFREKPTAGQPIVIQTVELTDPVVRLIERAEGQIVGFSGMLTGDPGGPTPDGGSTRLSDVLVIRRIAIVNGTIRYDPLNEPEMYLDQMTFELTSEPAHPKDPSLAGWYQLDANVKRSPFVNWTVESRLNIDTAVLDVRNSTLHTALDARQYEVLPPPLQAVIRSHEITGDFTATASGMLLLRNTANSDMRFDWRLANGHIAFEEYQLPVQSMEARARWQGGVLEFNPITASILGGAFNMDGELTLRGAQPMSLTFDAKELRIEQALRPISDGPPKYSGRLDVNGTLGGDLKQLDSTFNGNGALWVSEARLVNLPIIGGMVRAAGGMLGNGESEDRGNADVRLHSNRAEFSNIEVVSGAIGGRGEGTVRYDSTIDFRLNAGPLERVQGLLGKVGQILGKVTDKLVWYEVSGTLSEPVFTVRPLGLGQRPRNDHSAQAN
jgi:hypothetical protein